MKPRMALVFAIALVAGGLGLVLYFAFHAGSWMQLPARLLFTNQSFLGSVAFAVVGLALMALGMLSASRQAAALRTSRQRHADRLRRVADYRREPFISNPPAD